MRHPAGAESPLKDFTTRVPAQKLDAINRVNGTLETVDNETSLFMFQYFGNRAISIGDCRCTARHGLDHHQPKRLGPIDWKYKSQSPAEELVLFGFRDFANEFDKGGVEEWLDFGLKILVVDGIHLCCNLELDSSVPSDGDGAIDPFLWRDPSQKGQIRAGFSCNPVKSNRQSVVDGPPPICPAQG